MGNNLKRGFCYSILNIEKLIQCLNNSRSNGQKYIFKKLEIKNQQVNQKNYLDYNDQSMYVQKEIRKNLLNQKNGISLTEIINKYPDIKLSRVGWTNHLKKVIVKLKKDGYLVEVLKNDYKIRKIK